MATKTAQEIWDHFLEFVSERCSAIEFQNWFASIRVLETAEEEMCLEVPNIFVQEYLLENYKKDLCAFLPLRANRELALSFIVQTRTKAAPSAVIPEKEETASHTDLKLNPLYTFDQFIEGPANQFVKSAAIGIAHRP